MREHLKVLVCLVAVSLVWGGGAVGAAEKAAPTMNIQILKDADFNADHGVSAGKGTKTDPYVISGLELNSLDIENTSKYVDISKNRIVGAVVLDWIGNHAKLHYNTIGQLHVNRNVKRTGPPTSGTIVHNKFGNVTQLRHWDGVFAYNVVGTSNKTDVQAVNFDGFNGARFYSNKIYGFVDARLHGHHHSSGFGETSHMHDGMYHGVSHTQRYHSVSVTSNTIYAKHEYALAYLDTGHAGNDRTAASETDEHLNDKHAHHTRVELYGNRLYGSGILVDVFNSDDTNHIRTYAGSLDIEKNRILLGKDDFFSAKQLMGIEIRSAKDVHTYIKNNSIKGWKPGNTMLAFLEQWDTNAGINLHEVDKADVWLLGNSVENRMFGVRAANFSVSVEWMIGKLTTKNVNERVHYENVPRKPQAA
jgi:hypothetical protein